jgi:hypothetical protein
MDINNAASILVIIVSALLGLLLLGLIILVVLIMKLLGTLKRVAAKAEGVIDSAEAVTQAFKNVSGPMSALKLMKNLVELVSDLKKGKK